MFGKVRVLGLGGLVVLAGCQVQHTTVVEQATMASLTARPGNPPPAQAPAPVPRPSAAASSPCAAPAGTGPYELLPRPVYSANTPMPSRAMAEHVNGCAGIRFRLNPDGTPTDISIVADYPAGYGFGETGRAAVQATRWPGRDDAAWRYFIINMYPRSPRT